MRIRQALAVGLVTLAPALTGCLNHIRAVPKTHPPEVVMGATLDRLLELAARTHQLNSSGRRPAPEEADRWLEPGPTLAVQARLVDRGVISNVNTPAEWADFKTNPL